MPTPVLKSYKKQSGKTMAQVEKCWNDARKKADIVYKENRDNQYWAYVNIHTRMCLGIEKNKPKDNKDQKK